MKKSSQVLLFILMGVTMIMTAIMAFYVIFMQGSIPKLLEGPEGKPGPAPTTIQVAHSVEEYFKINPLVQPTNGKDAPPITNEQIAAAVANYLAANPPKPGKDGVNGLKGSTGSSCTTSELDGGAMILCEDGTSSFVRNGTDGRTPIPRCNESKNRWELSYIGDTQWTIMKSENGTQVRCKGISLL